MQPKNFPEANTRLAKDQDEFITLPVFSGYVEILGQMHPAMQSKWEPSADELARLNSGAPVSLIIVGTSHPPVIVGVDDVPVKS